MTFAARFVAPIVLVGRTALSVEIVARKILNAMFGCSASNIPCAEDVRLYGSKYMLLHEGNVFVCGRVDPELLDGSGP